MASRDALAPAARGLAVTLGACFWRLFSYSVWTGKTSEIQNYLFLGNWILLFDALTSFSIKI